jgi:hypothetical protein
VGISTNTGYILLQSNGGVQVEELSDTGIVIDATGDNHGTGPINLISAGGINLTSNSELGIVMQTSGTGGVNIDTGSGTGPIEMYCAGGVSILDSSASGMRFTESGAGAINFDTIGASLQLAQESATLSGSITSIDADLSTVGAVTVAGGPLKIAFQVLFANLPATPAFGMLAIITDSTVNTWGTPITVGGGTYTALSWYNGTDWTVGMV